LRQIVEELLHQSDELLTILGPVGRLGLADELLDLIRVFQIELAEGNNLPAARPPELVVTLVERDAVEPGKERPLAVELVEGKIDLRRSSARRPRRRSGNPGCGRRD